jgi:hypothetical protein
MAGILTLTMDTQDEALDLQMLAIERGLEIAVQGDTATLSGAMRDVLELARDMELADAL